MKIYREIPYSQFPFDVGREFIFYDRNLGGYVRLCRNLGVYVRLCRNLGDATAAPAIGSGTNCDQNSSQRLRHIKGLIVLRVIGWSCWYCEIFFRWDCFCMDNWWEPSQKQLPSEYGQLPSEYSPIISKHQEISDVRQKLSKVSILEVKESESECMVSNTARNILNMGTLAKRRRPFCLLIWV